MDASSPKPPPAEAGPVEVEPLDLKGRRRKGKGAGRSDALATGERGRVSVTQANPLALSRQEMGILSKRLLVLALSDVTRDDSDLAPIRITAWEFAQLFNIKGKSIYSRIEASARELLEQTVQIKEPNGDWVMFQWVSEARYEGGQGGKGQMASIELKIHDKLKPYLLQLRRDFSIIPADQLLSFESFNSMRLFEVLYTASYAGERPRLTFDVDDLKLRLGLDGKYERFKDFRYVLDRAQEEFKRYTCLTFAYEASKVGRKYQRVSFEIAKNDVFKPRIRLPASLAKRIPGQQDKQRLIKELQALDALREIGWAQDPERTVQRFGAERVVRIVDYARKLQARAEAAGRPIYNLPGFVNSLLTQGVEPPEQEPAQPQSAAALTRDEARAIASSIVDGYHQARKRAAQEAWDAMTPENRELVHTLMQATLHRFTLERVAAEGWTGPLYETKRLDVMASHGFVTFPQHLRDLEGYVATLDLLAEYPPDARDLIRAEIEEAS
ncbi:MAG TPA: replication initiation protein [Trueperaceae bacterium]|nr:replication initiation protein [Trueperaceae bacterium]